MRKWFPTILIISLLFFAQNTWAKNYYRYTDVNGKVIVKDRLSTDAVKRGYEIISDTGRVIQKVPPPLTKKQRIAEQLRQEQLKAQEEKRRKARQKDTLLLRQYKTVEDIQRTRNSQTSTLKINLRIINNHTKSLERKLQEQQAKAADFERKGKTVPDVTLHEISAIKNQIAANAESVERYNNQINDIEEQFQKDQIRFQELQAEAFVENSLRDQNLLEVKNIFTCLDRIQCDKAWSYAQIFALENASHPLSIITNTLIVSRPAQADNEVALTITRVPKRGELEAMNVVIKVDCYSSEEGKKLCQSPQVSAMKQKFVDYLASNS